MNINTQVSSPLSGWIGGKFLLSKQIIEQMPAHTCYVEPFAGAAWVFFRKKQSEVEVLNDINLEIITLYRVVKHHLEEFIKQFKWLLISRDEFERLKTVNPNTLTDIQRAARFYYLQQSCFGGRADNPSFSRASTQPPKLNLLRIEEHLSEAHLRLYRTYIECLHYSEIIKKYDAQHTLFYIDPPYWNCENYYGKGIFCKDDFVKISEQLKNIKGKFLLSINDSKEIRKIFSNFNILDVKTKYSVGNKIKVPKVTELLFKNF